MVAPTIVQRCPNTVRRPIATPIPGLPMTVQFSSTAEPAPIETASAWERITNPCDR